jgi:hypothetical protein
VPEGTVDDGRLGKREFHIDLGADTITCPGGHTVQINTSKTGFRGANFTTAMCRDCPLKPRCCPTKSRRYIRLQDHEGLLQAGRRALADPVTAEHLRRCRPRIERLLGLLAHRYGARKSRYIGSAKARCSRPVSVNRQACPQQRHLGKEASSAASFLTRPAPHSRLSSQPCNSRVLPRRSRHRNSTAAAATVAPPPHPPSSHSRWTDERAPVSSLSDSATSTSAPRARSRCRRSPSLDRLFDLWGGSGQAPCVPRRRA